MEMKGKHDLIKVGDHVLLYLDHKRTFLVKAEPGKVLHTHKGVVDVGGLVGRRFGEAVESSLGVRFYALRPLMRDYVMKMRRRTQIIYPKDVGLIAVLTGVGPGWRVVEAGTGSGALTAFLAYLVRPDGRVYSYEVREDLLEVAERNLEMAGVLDYVELKLGDVTEGIDEEDVDAVILDMATPWLVVEHAYESLRDSGSFLSFSPTIDQVKKTVKALRRTGFTDIQTYECLLRRIIVEEGRTRPETLMIGHTGYITSARKAVRMGG